MESHCQYMCGKYRFRCDVFQLFSTSPGLHAHCVSGIYVLLQKGVVATSPQHNYTLIEGATSHTYAALS